MRRKGPSTSLPARGGLTGGEPIFTRMSIRIAVLAGQAAAEYVAVTLRRAFQVIERDLGDLASMAEEHWLAIAVGAVIVIALWRVLSPRR